MIDIDRLAIEFPLRRHEPLIFVKTQMPAIIAVILPLMEYALDLFLEIDSRFSVNIQGNGVVMSLDDTNTPGPAGFYRIEVRVP